MSEREYKPYDVLVYHDLDSFVEPQLGMNGRELGFDEDRSVVRDRSADSPRKNGDRRTRKLAAHAGDAGILRREGLDR